MGGGLSRVDRGRTMMSVRLTFLLHCTKRKGSHEAPSIDVAGNTCISTVDLQRIPAATEPLQRVRKRGGNWVKQ